MDTQSPSFPTLTQALRYWFTLGCISFGGPAGQIALMHRELVEKRRWIDDKHFTQALNFCTLLPGPEAQQLATYLGWRIHGALGGVIAGGLFVLPSVFILLGLSWLYMAGKDWGWVREVFHGLIPVVIALVVSAVLRIGKKALLTPGHWFLAVAAFVGLVVANVSYAWIVLAAAIIGLVGYKFAPQLFPAGKSHGAHGKSVAGEAFLALKPVPSATWGRTAKILCVCLLLWWLPVVGLGLWLGWNSSPAQMGFFFSQAAVVTFGGAYAVLPYVEQQAVSHFGWLTKPQMMSGIALAETTPGPLIMVLQFVGFVGAWQHPGNLTPLMAGIVGALTTTWVTFLPCFLFVFLGGPYVQRLDEKPALSAALQAITAAVVGGILSLAWKIIREAVHPTPDQWLWLPVVLSIAAYLALGKFKVPLWIVLIAGMLSGLLLM